MVACDIICFLDDDNIVRHFEFRSPAGKDSFQGIWNEYLGKPIASFLDVDLSLGSGYASWQGTPFWFTKTQNVMGSGFILFMTSGTNNSKVYEEAMDCISEGIQIFDRNGYLLFCNKVSERIEKMDRTKIIGKHLLDIYELNEEYSTILNTIKAREPVMNRCDYFQNKHGEMITTMNSGYPLFIEDHLIGAIVLVQDVSILEQFWEKANIFEKYLSDRNNDDRARKKSNYYTLKYYTFNDLIGENESFVEAVNLSRNIALRDCAVMIYGETGTGKELFAQSIHSASNRKNKDFVAINCAAIPESLIEGILFGTEKGTFTGSSDRMGLFEQAEGGTLFLDEINSMGLHVQSKLLRVLQEKKFRRVGGLRDIDCDVRILSSTNEDPLTCVENNKLRKDLYYRINTVTITIPALRQRVNDIERLTNYFIDKLSYRYSKQVKTVSPEVINRFKVYQWPGNVRELLHALEYAFNIMNGNRIELIHLPKYLQDKRQESEENTSQSECKTNLHSGTLEQLMAEYEKKVLRNMLAYYQNNVSKTAKVLGIKRQSLQYRIKKYDWNSSEP